MEHGTETWRAYLADSRSCRAPPPYQVSGCLTRINGLVMEASGLLPLGSGCRIVIPAAPRSRPKWSASTARRSS